MTPKPSYISEDDFFDMWGAYSSPTDDLFQFGEISTQPHDRVWTVVESGDDDNGNWYAMPGIHLVNRIGFVLTTKPWIDEGRDAIYFSDDIEYIA